MSKTNSFQRWLAPFLLLAAVALAAMTFWPANPVASLQAAKTLDIGVLVFREGLECMLVIAALTANMRGTKREFKRPVGFGVVAGLVITVAIWFLAVRAVDDLSENFSALHVQALTGLVAVLVLITVMNWFFHKIYWTGWISIHNRKKEALLRLAMELKDPTRRVWYGLAALGFTAVLREGIEVVLFLQSYRLRFGGGAVASGLGIGLFLTVIAAGLTFVANRALPYRRMLVFTGVLLGGVLLVMTGEQAQEMQLAGWLPTTEISALSNVLPAWVGLWFSLYPTVETIAAQAIAAGLVIGSYTLAGRTAHRRARADSAATAIRRQPVLSDLIDG